MRDFESIQDRVNTKADEDLKAEIREIMKPLGKYKSFDNSGMYILKGEVYHQIKIHIVVEKLTAIIIETYKEANRDKASQEFMSKMAQMHDQFDEMIGFEEE